MNKYLKSISLISTIFKVLGFTTGLISASINPISSGKFGLAACLAVALFNFGCILDYIIAITKNDK